MPIYTDKRSGRFFVQFNYNKHTYKRYLPPGASKKEAQKLEAKLRSDVFFRSHEMVKENALFEHFVLEAFLPWVLANSPQNFEKADWVCLAALPFLKGKTLRAIDAADIEAFKAHRTLLPTKHGKTRQPATIWRELSVLSSLFRLAIDRKLCDSNPCSRVRKPVFDNTQSKVLELADEAKFLASFDEHQGQWAKDICILVLNTGLRQNDVLSLTRFHVDLNDNVIRLVQSKTKHPLVIPLNDAARTVIEKRLNKGPLLFPSPKTGDKAKSVRKALYGACTRAEIGILTIRDLRRTFATRLQENGVDAVTIAALLGHTSLRMVTRYARSSETAKRAVLTLVSTQNLPPAILKQSK